MKYLIPAISICLLTTAFALGFYFGRETSQQNLIVTAEYGGLVNKFLVDGKTGQVIRRLAPRSD